MENVTCDGTASCPDGTTCCKTKEGGWACCPLPEAVCCEDFIHCCPKGKKCNLLRERKSTSFLLPFDLTVKSVTGPNH
uniref:Granulins domain-containing protein n=1 Tax=Cyprinodon variegatus TaxID=28743 RepID=A0A3Q2D378_CYPVA